MSRSKKKPKEPISKKAKELADDMAEKNVVKKTSGKDKNWKNHLLDDDEQEADGLPGNLFEDFKDLDDSFSSEDEEDDF